MGRWGECSLAPRLAPALPCTTSVQGSQRRSLQQKHQHVPRADQAPNEPADNKKGDSKPKIYGSEWTEKFAVVTIQHLASSGCNGGKQQDSQPWHAFLWARAPEEEHSSALC